MERFIEEVFQAIYKEEVILVIRMMTAMMIIWNLWINAVEKELVLFSQKFNLTLKNLNKIVYN